MVSKLFKETFKSSLFAPKQSRIFANIRWGIKSGMDSYPA
jgi:hypothetical protein